VRALRARKVDGGLEEPEVKTDNQSSYGNTDRGVLQVIGLVVVNYSLLEEGLTLGVG
jgi:hypothetical protein